MINFKPIPVLMIARLKKYFKIHGCMYYGTVYIKTNYFKIDYYF